MPTKFITIVTPMYNKYYLTSQLLSDLLARERDNINQIIIVDDGSTEPSTIDGLARWDGNNLLPVRVLRQPRNVGFTLSANAGLRLATETETEMENHLVYLISNDVRIFGKFIEKSAQLLLSPQKHLIGNTLVAHDSGWNKFGDRVFGYLNGDFLAATADGWKELGYFDEAYSPGDFEDVDLSTLAKTKGYKLVPMHSPNIHHLGGGTLGYNPEREAITRRNQEYFRKKWIK